MQASSDIFLGWLHVEAASTRPRDFYVRQLQGLEGLVRHRGMADEGVAHLRPLCGWTLARAHARSGDRIAIAAYLGDSDAFDRAIADFAEAYADQNEHDYAALKQAVDTGRVAAQVGL